MTGVTVVLGVIVDGPDGFCAPTKAGSEKRADTKKTNPKLRLGGIFNLSTLK